MNAPTFVFLDIGRRKSAHLEAHETGIEIELQYSLATLKADGSACRTIIYTDRPCAYSGFSADIADISNTIASDARNMSFPYRAKPCVLLDALQNHGGTCIFLDSDTYTHRGFVQFAQGAVGPAALVWDVAPSGFSSHFPGELPAAPHRALHPKDARENTLGNSGVIGLEAGWGEAVLADAIHLVDVMRERGNRERTLEQTAIFEALWLHGRTAIAAKPWIEHYYTNSKKRYMHWQIKRLIAKHGRPLPALPPQIPLSAGRVKLYQYFWDLKRNFTAVKAALQVKQGKLPG